MELQGQHHALTQSYHTLQLEYLAVKEEWGSLRLSHQKKPPFLLKRVG
jgi:hypothetical protein